MIPRFIGLLTACVLAAPSAALAQAAAASFDSNGVAIHYVDRGRGAPVVLLHGFTGTYARHWESPGVIAALEEAGYRAIAMDCRGHGQSGKPHDASAYGMEMVRDVVRLLDHLQIARAHIVGYSMGGAIASQLLVGYPSRVLTVTMLGAGWEGDDLKAITERTLALADSFAKRDARPLIRAVNAPGQSAPTDAEVAAMNASLFARNDPDALAAAARGMIPLWDVPRARLQATTVPVLAIIGELDQGLPAVKRMAGVVPNLQVVELPGATHASSVRPSAAPLIAFLARHRN